MVDVLPDEVDDRLHRVVVNGTGTLQIIDILGRHLSNLIVPTSNLIAPTSNLIAPTSTLAPGVYVLRLVNGDGVKTQEIVVR